MSLPDFERATRPLPEPHLLVEVPGPIVGANLAARRFFGREATDLVGAAFDELVRMAGQEVRDFVASAASSGQLVPGRLTLVGQPGDGSFPVAAGAVRPAGGPDPALVLVRIDVSDQGSPFVLLTRKIEELTAEVRRRMALEAERTELLASERRARAAAEEAARLKDDFIATISHELRTPLNAILGWASMLKDGDVSADQESLAITTIERAARAQTQLVDDLLDFGRIVGGQLRLDVQEVDLPSVVRAALDTVRPAAATKDIRLEVVLDPRAGPVTGDPARLQQVVWNLLSNAIKFSSRGRRVQVRLERANSHVEIVVADQGRGIPAEFLPHVFDRFRQADSSQTRVQGGVGLGLAIARQLVEAHAGMIHAASEGPGKGATFTIILPLRIYQRPPPVAERTHPASEPASGHAARIGTDTLDGLDVLVLEDDDDSRRVLGELLVRRGARVRAVVTAAEAWQELDDALPDLILADIGLPDEDGYTFLRKLRAKPPADGGQVPAIAVTAFSRRVDRRRAFEAGFRMHLAKPVDPDELVAAIRTVVRGG